MIVRHSELLYFTRRPLRRLIFMLRSELVTSPGPILETRRKSQLHKTLIHFIEGSSVAPIKDMEGCYMLIQPPSMPLPAACSFTSVIALSQHLMFIDFIPLHKLFKFCVIVSFCGVAAGYLHCNHNERGNNVDIYTGGCCTKYNGHIIVTCTFQSDDSWSLRYIIRKGWGQQI